MARFETVSDEIIKRGECTDIYFVRTEETLSREKKNGIVVKRSGMQEARHRVLERLPFLSYS